MKRFLSVILLIIFSMMLCISASAESEILSLKYVPRSERGTLFYLDVYSGTDIGAAIFELHYDTDAAEYRGVSCDGDDATVMGNAESSAVKIAYSNRSSADGKLYRVGFKALQKGSLHFTLYVTQAVDGDLRYITDIPACSLDVTLAESDVVSSSASGSRTKEASTEASVKSYSGSKSDVYDENVNDDIDSESYEQRETNGIRNFSGSDKMMVFWMGAAAALLLCLLVIGCVIIGKRMKARRKAPPEAAEPEPEEDGDITLYEVFEADMPQDNPPDPPLPDVFKDIE